MVGGKKKNMNHLSYTAYCCDIQLSLQAKQKEETQYEMWRKSESL